MAQPLWRRASSAFKRPSGGIAPRGDDPGRACWPSKNQWALLRGHYHKSVIKTDNAPQPSASVGLHGKAGRAP